MSFSPYVSNSGIQYNSLHNRMEVNTDGTGVDFVVLNDTGDIVFQAGQGMPDFMVYPHISARIAARTDVSAMDLFAIDKPDGVPITFQAADTTSFQDFARFVADQDTITIPNGCGGLYRVELNLVVTPPTTTTGSWTKAPLVQLYTFSVEADAKVRLSAFGTPVLPATVTSYNGTKIASTFTNYITDEFSVCVSGMMELAAGETFQFKIRTSTDIAYGPGINGNSTLYLAQVAKTIV